jgi:GR25 family glycosyltransferase involved in LPS biosynthesis
MINKIYYINLDRRPERNIYIQKQINNIKYNGPIERISAIDGKLINIDDIPDNIITTSARNDIINIHQGVYRYLTYGALGCALSHLIIYNKVIKELNDTDYVLILEDDVTIKNNFLNILKDHINTIPNFDMLYLGYHQYSVKNEFDDNIVGIPETIYGTFGYIINKKAALELIKLFPLDYQIDTEIPKVFDNLNVFFLKDQLVTSYPSQAEDSVFKTDIQLREQFTNMSSNNVNKSNINNVNNVNKSNKNNLSLLIILLLILLVYIITKK